MTIWKHAIDVTDSQTILMPRGAVVLDAQMQRGQLCIWAIVDPDADVAERRQFRIIGTGHTLPEWVNLKYISTVQDGALVWHVFEDQR